MRLLIYLLAVIHWTSEIKCQQTGKDRTLNVPKLIKSRGFKVETHHVITEDGYILTIHRIVNPLRDSKGRPVILQHGLLSSGRDWIDNALGGAVEEMYSRSNKFVGNNLGFELSKAGHDVWLTNSRGNTYGRNHTKLNHKTGMTRLLLWTRVSLVVSNRFEVLGLFVWPVDRLWFACDYWLRIKDNKST